jgi:hypothetical protein
MNIIHRVMHRGQTKVHVPGNSEEKGPIRGGKLRVALGTELRLGGGRLRRQRSAIRQDHMRNDVAVRSMAGSVVLNDCTLS